MPANLNRKQQREIKAVVERAKKDNGIPQTAQQSIPFQRMFPDGICRVTDSYYTKTIQFQDINYHHGQCCKAHISGCFDQKENRHSDERRRTKAK